MPDPQPSVSRTTPSFIAAVALALGMAACGGGRVPVAPAAAPQGHGPSEPPGSPRVDPSPGPDRLASDEGPFFNLGRDFGTDAYAGPFDVLLNKGFAVAQWEGKGRDIFHYPYGWRSVWHSLTEPGRVVANGGGWTDTLLRHVVPFARGGVHDAQWVPNYVGHILEGGIAYRRLREWGEANGVPYPSVVAGVTTYAASLLNEAYETPYNDRWATKNGTAGSVLDLWLFDPLGIVLFHQDWAARFFARKVHANLWPTQASLVVNGGLVMNNGELVVLKVPLGFTSRAHLFVAGGMGLEGGVSVPLSGGLSVSAAAGGQSSQRWLDAFRPVEHAEFTPAAGVWVDRDGALLASLTWDAGTDRRVALNVFPGFLKVGGADLGGWFLVDALGRPYFGFAGARTLGAGLGVGF